MHFRPGIVGIFVGERATAFSPNPFSLLIRNVVHLLIVIQYVGILRPLIPDGRGILRPLIPDSRGILRPLMFYILFRGCCLELRLGFREWYRLPHPAGTGICPSLRLDLDRFLYVSLPLVSHAGHRLSESVSAGRLCAISAGYGYVKRVYPRP